MNATFPKIGCSYIPPDQCTSFTPASCCERIDEDAGLCVMASMALLSVLSALAALL